LAGCFASLVDIDATDAGSAEMSLKKPDFAFPFAISNHHQDLQLRRIESDEKFAILFHGPPRSSLELGAGASGAPPVSCLLRRRATSRREHMVLLANHDVHD
jgi:hypothetical protein